MAHSIEVNDLVKTYPGDVRALDELSFAVEEGTVFGLLGPNGAGKSTAVKILTTLAQADSGQARVAGFDVRSRCQPRAPQHRRRGAAFERRPRGHRPREPAPAGAASTACAAASSRGARASCSRASAWPTRRIGSRAGYSGGMERRLDIAMALIHRPERAVPRRAHHRPRPRGARRHVGGDRPPEQRARADDPADHPLPRGGGPSGLAARDRRPRPRRCRGHARRAEERAPGRRDPRRAGRRRGERPRSTRRSRRSPGCARCSSTAASSAHASDDGARAVPIVLAGAGGRRASRSPR